MSVEKLLAAVLGIFVSSQIAAASTFHVEDYAFKLRFDGTSLDNLVVIPHEDPDGDPINLNIAPGEYEYGISEYTHLTIGDIVDFIVTVSFPVPEPIVSGGLPNGGTTPVCVLGGRDCSEMNFTSQQSDSFILYEYDYDGMSVPLTVGTQFSHSFWGLANPDAFITNDYGSFFYEYQNAYFTVIEIVDELAPIPLPAGALLLPAGLGALMLFRRKRRADALNPVEVGR